MEKMTMKKYIIFIASAVLMMAACAKEEINTTTGGKEFFSIELNAATKTQLDGMATVWTEGDMVRVTVGGVSGKLTLSSDLKTFTGELETGGLKGELEAIINYPADLTSVPTTQKAVAGSFEEEAALLEGKTTLANLRAGKGGNLANKTALLQFTVAQAGDVTFEVGTKKYTVTGCQTGETYYACVAPASNVSFVARIDGYFSKKASKNQTFTASKIAKLGDLPAPEASDWTISGAHNSWGTANLYKDDSGYAVIKNITLTGDFKLIQDGVWHSTMVPTIADKKWCLLKQNMPNNYKSGTYDLWVHEYYVCLVTAGSTPPAFNNTNKQYYIVLEHNWNWANRKLYAFNRSSNDAALLGSWPGKVKDGTFKNDNKEFSYWAIPSSVYGKKLGIIFSNNGADQTQDLIIDNYQDDKRYWLNYDGSNKAIEY